MKPNNVPHKHAAVIKAWADGATIEKWVIEAGFPAWMLCYKPEWNEASFYRVKPAYPTLGEIAKEAWSITATNNKEKDGMFARPKWDAAAKAVADAIKSGEYSEGTPRMKS